MSDLIDRQAVLDTIHLFFTEEIDKIPTKKTEDGEVIIICKAQPLFTMNKTLSRRIKELPPVNPQEPIYYPPCEDCHNKMNEIRKAYDKIQSAEPKTGHWEWLTEDKYRCSNCNSETRVDECMNVPMYEFCPFCGAKMAESEE